MGWENYATYKANIVFYGREWDDEWLMTVSVEVFARELEKKYYELRACPDS